MVDLDMQAPRLVGRASELGVLDDFVRGSVSGGGALLLTGDPGVGKSALLDAAVRAAAAHGTRVIRGGGVEYEADVGFAVLHQLLGPLGDHVEELPASRRSALQVALGLASGPAPDRLSVLDAALATFRRAAAAAPLLVVVDDMHWLDEATASVIGFVGRRLADSRVGLLGAARTGAGGFAGGAGWRELVVPALGHEASLDLLGARFAHLPARVRRDVVEEAQGNPLALLEFAAAEGSRLTPGAQCAATVATGAGREVRRLYDERVARLPADTRLLLLLAALEGSGNLAVLASAGGPGLQALGAAERDHLVIVDERVGELFFRHPMVKTVVVEESTHDERRTAHARLAEVFTGQVERRGLHLAEAAVEPSEEVAAAVEAGADATLRRGDVVGGVSRLLRAADLSPDPSARGRRLARAAFVRAFSEGRLESASLMLREARRDDPGLGDSLPAAAASAYLLLNTEGDVETSHRLLVEAVDAALDDPGRDEEVLSLALYTLVAVCHFAGRPEPWDALDDLLGRLQPSSAPDAVLLAQAHGDPARATPWALREIDRAVSGLGDTLDAGLVVRTGVAGFYLDRLSACRPALDRVVRDGLDGGAAGSAVMALNMVAFDDLGAGRWDGTRQAANEAITLGRNRGYTLYEWSSRYALALVAAHRGEHDECRTTCDEMVAWARPRGVGRLDDCVHHVLARAALGAGDFTAAFEHASAVSGPGILEGHNPQALWCALDLVDAALHSGRAAEADAHVAAMRAVDLGRLSPRFALVTAAAEAMVASDDEAPHLFEDALTLPGADSWPFELARVRLAHGERLRRLRRAREARTQLVAARDGFDRLGASPWSRRASTELRATGPTRGVGGGDGAAALTPQELEVVQLAAGGLTNREIATRLFVSPRTVSTHLYRAFPKLGVSTRAALRDALGVGSDDVS